ncbi:glycoside hydrolase family 3 protein [Halobacterium noricense]|uniref:beta-N-acetylhexosaminidase n=2 Tax=Haladaptatus pallidirubidus TaxID=1008152 RepID=A0AAV3UJC4_9EURY
MVPGLASGDGRTTDTDYRSRVVQETLTDLSDREKVGQMVMALMNPTDDGQPSSEAEAVVKDLKVGSAMVEHIDTPAHTAEFNNQLQRWASETESALPLFVGADFEFGTAHSVGDLRDDQTTQFPRNMNLGALRSKRAAADSATITATEARAMGYHWGFAPVADVNTNPSNPVIGIRSFGGDTDLASSLTAAQVSNFQAGGRGIVATAKHFPGHGDTHVDSHTGLPVVSYDRETLENVHLPPFEAAIDAGADALMTAHIVVEAIDPERPATLSPPVLTGLLRDELGFNGLIVTDAMSMQAITDIWGQDRAAVLAAKAGADVVMSMGDYETHAKTVDALYDAVQIGELSMERVEEAVARVLETKMKYGLLSRGGERRSGRIYVEPERATHRTGMVPHRRRAAEIARDSMTLVKNEDVLPFDDETNATTLVAGVIHTDVIASAVRDTATGDVVSWQSSQWRDKDPTDEEIDQAATLAADADRVLVATYSASDLPEGQARLVDAVRDTGTPTAAVSVGLPYDIASYPDVDAYLASYALDRWAQLNVSALEAAVDVVFGVEPRGALPVRIDGHYPYGHGLRYENE